MVWDDVNETWVDAYSGSEDIVVGTDYTLGSTTLTARCLSVSGTNAIMQTYGISFYSGWPGSGDLTNTYSGSFGDLAIAVSGVRLPTGTSSSSISPSGANAVLQVAATRSEGYKYCWLGSTLSTDVYIFGYDGSVIRVKSSNSGYVSAPYFTLDLTKVKIKNGVITAK